MNVAAWLFMNLPTGFGHSAMPLRYSSTFSLNDSGGRPTLNEHSPMPEPPDRAVPLEARRRAPDRRVRVLERLRQHAPARHRPVGAVERVLVVGPAADDVLERLLPHRARVLRVDAEALELGARRRAAGAELDAPVGEQVEHRDRLRGAHRVVVRPRQQAHAVAEPQPRRLGGDVPVEDLGVRAVRELLEEVVLDRPQAVEARLLAEHGLLDDVLVRLVLAVAAPRPRDRDLVEQCQLHRRPSSFGGTPCASMLAPRLRPLAQSLAQRIVRQGHPVDDDSEVRGDGELGDEVEVAVRRDVAARDAVVEQRAELRCGACGCASGPTPSTCATRTNSSSTSRVSWREPAPRRPPCARRSGAAGRRWCREAGALPRAARGALERALGELFDQVLLGREVVVEGLLGDVGGVGDLERRGRREALALEERDGRLEDPLVDLAAAALAPARRRIGGRRRHGQSPVPWAQRWAEAKLGCKPTAPAW